MDSVVVDSDRTCHMVISFTTLFHLSHYPLLQAGKRRGWGLNKDWAMGWHFRIKILYITAAAGTFRPTESEREKNQEWLLLLKTCHWSYLTWDTQAHTHTKSSQQLR